MPQKYSSEMHVCLFLTPEDVPSSNALILSTLLPFPRGASSILKERGAAWALCLKKYPNFTLKIEV